MDERPLANFAAPVQAMYAATAHRASDCRIGQRATARSGCRVGQPPHRVSGWPQRRWRALRSRCARHGAQSCSSSARRVQAIYLGVLVQCRRQIGEKQSIPMWEFLENAFFTRHHRDQAVLVADAKRIASPRTATRPHGFQVLAAMPSTHAARCAIKTGGRRCARVFLASHARLLFGGDIGPQSSHKTHRGDAVPGPSRWLVFGVFGPQPPPFPRPTAHRST